MAQIHQTLLDLLAVEPLEPDLFRGTGQGGETATRIFGGQVIGQALAAAYGTVSDRPCHSLHAYFIRPGDPAVPVLYRVDRARDGGSFTTRQVAAMQHGKQILTMTASFHLPEDGWAHQHPMPDVPGPEGLDEIATRRRTVADQIRPARRDAFLRPSAIDLREVAPRPFFKPPPQTDVNHIWFRMRHAKGTSPQMQHCLLAYASDLKLLASSLRPHGLTWLEDEVMSASLDHVIHFHGDVQFQDWHLYAMDSPWGGAGRGLNRGLIYDQAGRLVASTLQEGLVRKRR